MWSALRHPNVLPLLGATTTDTRYAMVSKWMTDGNINVFMETHPDADRLGLVGSSFGAHLLVLVDDRPTFIAGRRR